MSQTICTLKTNSIASLTSDRYDDANDGLGQHSSSSHSMVSSLSPTFSTEFEEHLNDNYQIAPRNKRKRTNHNHQNEEIFKYKALQIIEILFKDYKSLPFRCAVDEKRDNAPNYYQTIVEPMDLAKLKLLITNGNIPSPKQFVRHLMLIWDNATTYNAPNLEIYSNAAKLKTLSVKLIREYWPNQYKSLYESKRKSRRIRQNKKIANIKYSEDTSHPIRQYLMCGQCDATLTFMCGFHLKCNTISIMKCIECNININDTKISYYHCLNGCESTNNYHSLVLCEFCAEKHFDSKQMKIKNKCIAFRGLFLDLSAMQRDDNELDIWFEAIIMKQDSISICYELIFSSETKKRWVTEAQIIDIDNRIFQVIKTKKWTDFTKGILSEDGLSLRFIDKEEPNNSDPNIFKKVQVECRKCGSQCMFMTHSMLPSNDASSQSIYCDTHHIYNQQAAKDPTQRCLCFKSMDDKCKNNIQCLDFYFSCVQCNDFDQCQMCTLIQYEQAFKRKMQNVYNNNIAEPPRKKQRVMSKCVAKKQMISTIGEESLYEEYIHEKRRNQQLKNENGIIKNELEIAMFEKNKWEQKCNKVELQLQSVKAQKDEYFNKFHQLKQKMTNVLAEFD